MSNHWRPIHTAPRDETDIMVATSGGQYVVYWLITDSVEYDEGGAWYVQVGSGDSQPLYERPTHWMPLPEPPAKQADNQEPAP